MKSTCESLKVFDFNEEDELSEMASARFMTKFKNPNSLDKYQFLQDFAQGTKIRSKEIGNIPCVDVDEVDNDRNGNYAVSYTPLDAGVECATKGMSELDDFPQNNSTSPEQDPRFIPNKLQRGNLGTRDSNPELASTEKDESVDVIPDSDESLNGSSPSSSSNNVEDGASLDEPSSEHCFAGCEMDESVDVIPDSDEGLNGRSPSSSSNNVEDGASLDEPSSEHCFAGCEMGERNMTVSICPDYIVYHGNYCTESRLIFSSNCITMKGSGNQGTLSFQWGIDDIIDIESRWFGRLEMTMIKIRIISKDTVEAASGFGTSGIEELKFSVVDSNWYEKQEEITSLDVRYSALWTVVFDADIGRFGDASDISSQKSYFPNFEEPFEEVVYPEGDPDAVSISKRDVDLLQPEMFVNDTIIDFYIKYLKNNIELEERQRFHFFNSFFFRKLADLDKDPSSAFEGRAAFQRVRKWTRKVNLFEKDYVFIPVNFNYHWSLIVICHPGEVAKFEDEDVHKSLKVPCILHMDSIRGSHTGLKDLVQSYLWEEWKEKQKEISEDISSKFFNLRYVPLELPQQQNSYDCGLFLLHYVELFLEEAPVNFNPFKITKFSSFLNVDWFLPPEASLKRGLIQRLICGLLDNNPREISQASGGEKHFTSNCPESINNNETSIEIISERFSSKRNDGNSLCSQADQGVEITLLPTSSMRSSQCVTDSALVFREYFEPGVTAGSFLDEQYQSFSQSASFNKFKSDLSPIEEDIEASGHFIYPPAAEYGVQRVAEITSAACGFSYSSRDFAGETSWNPEISVHQIGHEDSDSSPEISVCASDDSLEVELNDNNNNSSSLSEDLDVRENLDQKRSESPENTQYLTEGFASAGEIMDVPDSQEPELMVDGDGDTDLLAGCKSSVPGLTHQDGDVQENEDGSCDDVRLIGDDSDSEADVQENGDGSCDDVRLIGDDSVSEADVQENEDGSCDDVRLIGDDSVAEADVRAAKRLRLMPPTEEGKLT